MLEETRKSAALTASVLRYLCNSQTGVPWVDLVVGVPGQLMQGAVLDWLRGTCEGWDPLGLAAAVEATVNAAAAGNGLLKWCASPGAPIAVNMEQV